MTTVREIAEFAGVSKSTVSLVLNNKPGVSEQMRQVVLDAVEQLKAEAPPPSTIERTPSSALSIVVLHPPVLSSSYVFSEVLQGIQAEAENHRVQLRLVMNDPDASPQHVSHLYFSDPNLRPDGVLVFGAQQHEPLIAEAQKQSIPCVVMGREANKYDVSGIGRNEERYGYEATQYLIELGHRAIAFIGGNKSYDYLHNRYNGYVKALREANISISESWVWLGDNPNAMQSALNEAPEITAVIFVNDKRASESLPVIAAHGLKIPDDISVISFDDTDIARNFDPPLTSISYNRYEEGKWAVKMLIDQIRHPFVEKVQTIFKAELIKRESCATCL